MLPDLQIAPRSQTPSDDSAVLEEPALAPVLLPENKNDKMQRNETNCFVARNWQLAYAEALLEDALPFLPISIVLAERAILNRYLELHDNPQPLEERLEPLACRRSPAEIEKESRQNLILAAAPSKQSKERRFVLSGRGS